MKGRRLIKRVLGLVLTGALAIGMIPPIESKAATTGTPVQVPTTMQVLTPLVGNGASAGEYIYIVEDGYDRTGQLPSSVSARIIKTSSSNSASNYIGNYNGGQINYTHYADVNQKSAGFDDCPRGAIVSNNGSSWKYFCSGSYVKNLDVQPYVARTATGTFTITMPNDTVTITNNTPRTITVDDLKPLQYNCEGSSGNLETFVIDPNDNTIGPNDNHITVKYGLNNSESQVINLPVKYTVNFDANGGNTNGTMGTQTVGTGEKITAPATNPTRTDYVFQGWTVTKNGNDYWDFNSGNTQPRTLYARWRHVQTITASDTSVIYGNNKAAGATCLGGAGMNYTVTSGTDVISVSSNGTISANKVGTATLKIDAPQTETYVAATKSIRVTVEKRNVILNAVSKEKTYGTDDPALSYVVDASTPLVHGDTIATAFTGALTREEGNNVGTYTISGANIAASNYNITAFNNATLTINKRPVNVVADNKTIIYGMDDAELTFTACPVAGIGASGLYGDDTLDIVLMRQIGSNAGEYVITPMMEEGANANYDVTFTAGTYTITTTDVTIKDIVAEDKEYDGTDDAVVSAVVEGVNGEIFTIENLKGTFDSKNVQFTEDGEYAEQTVTLSGVITEGTGRFANYTYNGIPFASDAEIPTTTAKIYPKAIKVIAYDTEKFYGDEDPEFTWGLDEDSTLPAGEDLANIADAKLTRIEGEAAGSYTIVIAGTKLDPNYNITFGSGRFTVTPYENVEVFRLEEDKEIKGNVELAQSDDELLNMLLTDEEKKMVEDGAGVKVWFEVDPANEVTAKDLFIINLGLPTGYDIGTTYDINLYKKFAHLDREQLHETPEEIGFSIKVPDELLNVPEGVTRDFVLVRVHDGKAEVIPSSFDPATGCVNFGTDRFSYYTIAFKDTEVKTEVPKTGDATPVQHMMAMMILAGFGMALATYARRKKEDEI